MRINNMTIDELIKKYKNKKGDEESETIICDNNMDKRVDNTVSVWAMASDVAKIAERCRNAIVSFEERGNGVDFKIHRKAFRGAVYAFRKVK